LARYPGTGHGPDHDPSVAATLAYISHDGEAPFEDDRGLSITQSEQKALLKDWHLELFSGQCRPTRTADGRARRIKLVHNVVVSMPSPTPAKAVLAAARHFAREKFGAQHRYVMALHTHQQHPHVHLVQRGPEGTWYICWYSRDSRQTERLSTGSSDLETARKALYEHALRHDRVDAQPDAQLARVMQTCWVSYAQHLPSAHTHLAAQRDAPCGPSTGASSSSSCKP
jgi:hypothetical protein